MLTASSSRPTLAIVAAATLLGVVVGTTIAFLAGGTGGGDGAKAVQPPTSTTLPEEFYTVVLASIADGPGARADAERRAEQLREAGIEAGLLDSSDYGSLNAGYMVVFSGRFATEAEAQRHLEQLKANGLPGGPNPYVRQVADPKR
jgi:hypothetical protein